MTTKSMLYPRLSLPLIVLSCLPLLVQASALTLTSYGTEGTFMGGADVAVARDSFAVNTNPA